MVAALALLGCDDESAGADGSVGVDGGGVDGASGDAVVDGGPDAVDAVLDAAWDAVLDAARDAEVDAADMADAAPRDPVVSRALPLDEAVIDGPHTVLEGEVLLDPGGTLRWTIDAPGELEAAAVLHLAVAAELWRVEDVHSTLPTWSRSPGGHFS